MEHKTFTEFQKLLGQIQARKDFLAGEINELSRELATKQAAFDPAILEGADPEELQAELDALQKKIDLKRREFNALDAALSGKAKSGKVHEAARAVWNEGVEIITKDLRGEWDASVAKLEKLKKDYLGVCAELGMIRRKADAVNSRLSYGLEQFLPPAGAPSLSTGIYEEKHIGIIFPDYHEIKKAYQKGV